MHVYSVYEPPQDDRSPAERAGDFIFVRDSFSRAALIFGPAWLIIKRQWAALAFYVLLAGVFALIMYVAATPSPLWSYVYLALNIIVGFEAPVLRGMQLEAQGWRSLGITEARNDRDAEYRFLKSYLDQPEPKDSSGPTGSGAIMDRLASTPEASLSPVLREARPPRILN